MSRPERYPRLCPQLFSHSGSDMPVRLDFDGAFPYDDTFCYWVRSKRGEWLSYPELPPQMIGIPPWAVTLLGGMAGRGEIDHAAVLLGYGRYNRAYNVENCCPHDPSRHLPMPEKSIADEARAMDVNLVPPGLDPTSLSDRAKATYHAKLSLITEVGTLGCPVGNSDEVLYARRTIFEAEEREMVKALIATRIERYAEEGESLAEMYACERARTRS